MNYKLKQEAGRYLFMLLGCLSYALSIDLFLVPNEVVTGGVTGAAVLVHLIFGIKVGAVSVLINLPILICALRRLGWKFVARCLLTTAVLGACIDLMAPLQGITDNLVLASLYAGICQGIGIGLFFRYEVSSGGTELLARLLMPLFKGMTLGTVLAILDGTIVLAGLIIMGNPEKVLGALIVIAVSAKVSDVIICGLGHTKMCYIITDCPDEISDYLLRHSPHGITKMIGEGMYRKQERSILLSAVKSRQLPLMKKTVSDIDPHAFMIVGDGIEAFGNGFKSFFE